MKFILAILFSLSLLNVYAQESTKTTISESLKSTLIEKHTETLEGITQVVNDIVELEEQLSTLDYEIDKITNKRIYIVSAEVISILGAVTSGLIYVVNRFPSSPEEFRNIKVAKGGLIFFGIGALASIAANLSADSQIRELKDEEYKLLKKNIKELKIKLIAQKSRVNAIKHVLENY